MPDTEQAARTPDDVFLSPRVLDQGAFNDFAGELRSIMSEAAQAVEEARASGEESQGLKTSLDASAEKLKTYLDTAGKVLRTIDERATEAQALYQKVSQRATSLEELESHADELISRKTSDLERALGSSLDRFDSRIAAMRAKLDELVRDAETRAEEAQENVTKCLVEAEQRSTQLGSIVDGALARADGKLEALSDESDRVIEASRAKADGLVDEYIGVVQRAIGDIDEKVDAAEKRLLRPIDEMEARIERMKRDVNSLVTPGLEQVQEACERAVTILGFDPTDTDAGAAERDSLADLISRAELIKSQAATANTRLNSIRDQADESRKMLSESLQSSVDAIAELASKRESLEATFREAIGSADGIESKLQARVGEAKKAMEAPLAEIRETAAEITRRARELAQQAHEAQNEAEETAEWNSAILLRIEDALAKLEPWREVLLTEGSADSLPKPLADLVSRAYDELSRPLMELGSVIQTVAQRATLPRKTENGNVQVLAAGPKKPRSARSQRAAKDSD